jgi:short-subunit dehydrogenase
VKRLVERFGPWALVTGASSGIGEAFARRLAEMGLNLVLVALPEDRLKRVADDLQRAYSVRTRLVPVDLSQGDFLPPIQQGTGDLHVGLLVNNAGIATTGRFLDNDLAAELTMVHINNCAPLSLAHHFGRLMRQRGRGGIIFVSSIAAYAAIPSMSNYAASKAHDLVFAEGLARELRQDGISVLALCPGPMRTNLWPAGSTLFLPMQPEVVVDIALKKLGRKTTVVAGRRNALTAFATRLLPRAWNAAIFGSVIEWTLKGVQTPRQVTGANARPAALIQGG